MSYRARALTIYRAAPEEINQHASETLAETTRGQKYINEENIEAKMKVY